MATVRTNNAGGTSHSDDSPSNKAIMDAGKEAGPMLKRTSVHRDRIDQTIRELESEKFELVARIEHLRRQFETIERGFSLQIADVEETLKLYENGLNSVPMRTH